MLHALRSVALAVVCLATRAFAQIWTQDSSFHPVLTNDVPALTSATFVPAADGRVLVFGAFTHLQNGAVPAQGLAFLGRDGTLDPTFTAAVDSKQTIVAAVPLSDGHVLAERRNADTTFSIVRFQANGQLDPTFSTIPTASMMRLTLEPDGRIVGSAFYIAVNGQYYDDLVRFNADGTFDSSFKVADLTLSSMTVAVQPDGKILGLGAVKGMATIGQLIRFNVDGTRDMTFTTTSNTFLFNALALQGDGKILAGGLGKLQRFNADGTVDATFAPALPGNANIARIDVRADGQIVVQASVGDIGQPSIPTVFLVSADGGTVKDVRTTIGSDETAATACVLADNTSWLIHGKPVSGYAPLIPMLTPGMPGSVTSTTTNTGGTTSSSSNANSTTAIMPVMAPNIVPARAALTRVSSDFGTTADLSPGFLSRTDGYIGSMKVDAASRLTIQGQFTAVDGVPRQGLARFTPSGTLDPTYAPSLGDAQLTRVLLFAADGEMLITTATLGDRGSNGIYTATEHVVRLREDGSIDASFAPTLSSAGDVGWLAIAPDGRVLVSYFTPDNDHEENLRLGWLDNTGKIATTLPTRFAGLHVLIAIANGPIETVTSDAGGSADPSGSAPTNPGVYGNPFSFARLLPDGKILLGGMFERVNGMDRPRLVRLNSDGSVDPTYAPDFSGLVEEPFVSLDARGRVMLNAQTLRDGKVVTALFRLLDSGARDPGYFSVADVAPNTLLRLDNGLPDLNFPTQITRQDGTTATLSSALMANDGTVWTVNPLARFTPTDVATVTVNPTDRFVNVGRDTTFFVGLGTRHPATYQWLFNGTPIAGATLPYLALTAVTPSQGGDYSVRVAVDGQTLTSGAGTLTVLGGTVRLVNFSARAYVGPNDAPVAGFVIAGGGNARDWLLRAMGPTLVRFGVTSALSDPDLTLFDGTSELAHDHGSANNPAITEVVGRVGAFPAYVPFPAPFGTTNESALVRTLSPGAYTASATSAGGNSGTVLLEVYDTNPGASGSLRNVSVRTRTAGGENTATLGFVLAGNVPARLLIRGIGPTLGTFGVHDAITDPQLVVFGFGHSTPVATNSGWANDNTVADAVRASGAFALPDGSRDAALVIRLEPGAYTTQLTSASGATGEGMIEVYVIDQ